MWDEFLHRIDWSQLHHAYGNARTVPTILRKMISPEQKTRDDGWDSFYGAVNHQGDFYNSTVAAVEFLLEAVKHPETPDRARILNYLCGRFKNGPEYGGDPHLLEPPGGYDEPTPLVWTPVPVTELREDDESESDEEHGPSRSMELCAWQVGRRILEAMPTFLHLLDDPDSEVATAAAILVMQQSETRTIGKRTLSRMVELERDPVRQAKWILEFGVFASRDDDAILANWLAPTQPLVVRAAAAITWAWLTEPAAILEPATSALRAAAEPTSDVFQQLPWTGVYRRGPWELPSNLAKLPLWLAENRNSELRWRAVQGLELTRDAVRHLSPEQVIPVLVQRLADPINRIRNSAAYSLAQRGETVLDHEPDLVAKLLAVLDGNDSADFGDQYRLLDDDATACGHAARLLAAIAHRMSAKQRRDAVARIDRVITVVTARGNPYVSFGSMGRQAVAVLEQQRKFIEQPTTWNLPELFAAFAWCHNQDTRLSPQECDQRLATAYRTDPIGTVNTAISQLVPTAERSALFGAAKWLATLGPVAAPALDALDRISSEGSDSYVREQCQTIAKWIRASVRVIPEPTSTTGDFATIEELLALLRHDDPLVRWGAANLLTRFPPSSLQFRTSLEDLLTEESFAEVGIPGPMESEGRLYHWHRARRSPRLAAIRAFFTLGSVPTGDRLLLAMLAESARAVIVCGNQGTPSKFSFEEWKLAVDAAGGFRVAEQHLRTARQSARNAVWSNQDSDGVAVATATNLDAVIRRWDGVLGNATE